MWGCMFTVTIASGTFRPEVIGDVLLFIVKVVLRLGEADARDVTGSSVPGLNVTIWVCKKVDLLVVVCPERLCCMKWQEDSRARR